MSDFSEITLREPRDEFDQPLPHPSTGPSMHDLVVADLMDRKELGRRRYGSFLQKNNGRDALLDAYQELLDFMVYFRQVLAERNAEP